MANIKFNEEEFNIFKNNVSNSSNITNRAYTTCKTLDSNIPSDFTLKGVVEETSTKVNALRNDLNLFVDTLFKINSKFEDAQTQTLSEVESLLVPIIGGKETSSQLMNMENSDLSGKTRAENLIKIQGQITNLKSYLSLIKNQLSAAETQLADLNTLKTNFVMWRQDAGIPPMEYKSLEESRWIEAGLSPEEAVEKAKTNVDNYTAWYNSRFDEYVRLYGPFDVASEEELNKKMNLLENDISNYKNINYYINQTIKMLPYSNLNKNADYESLMNLNKYYEFTFYFNGPEEYVVIDGKNYLYSDVNYIAMAYLASLHETFNSRVFEGECDVRVRDAIEEAKGIIKYLSVDEINNYNYIFETEGKDKAEQYLIVLKDTINQRKGAEEALTFLGQYNSVGTWFEAAGISFKEGVGDGLKQFFEGLGNVFSADGVLSDTQYKQMMILQALGGKITDPKFKEEFMSSGYSEHDYDTLCSYVYKFGISTGNMLPTIAASMLMNAFAAPTLGITAAKVGQLTGDALIALSSGGNAANSALASGVDGYTAVLYGITTGLSEGGLEYLFGNIPGLSKESSISLIGWLKEGTTEGMQQMVEIMLNKVCLGEEISIEDAGGQLTESFMMGVFMSMFMTGGEATINYYGAKVKLTTDIMIDCLNNKGTTNLVDYIVKSNPNINDTINAEIKGLIDNGDIETALGRLKKLEEDGIETNFSFINQLDSMLDNKKYEEAYNLYSEITANQMVSMNLELINMLENGDFSDAVDKCKRIENYTTFAFDARDYVIGLLNSGNIELTMKMFSEFPYMQNDYNILSKIENIIKSYIDSNDIDKTVSLIFDFNKNKINKLCTRVFELMTYSKNFDGICDILDGLLKRDINKTSFYKDVNIDELIRKTEKLEDLNVVERLKKLRKDYTLQYLQNSSNRLALNALMTAFEIEVSKGNQHAKNIINNLYTFLYVNNGLSIELGKSGSYTYNKRKIIVSLTEILHLFSSKDTHVFVHEFSHAIDYCYRFDMVNDLDPREFNSIGEKSKNNLIVNYDKDGNPVITAALAKFLSDANRNINALFIQSYDKVKAKLKKEIGIMYDKNIGEIKNMLTTYGFNDEIIYKIVNMQKEDMIEYIAELKVNKDLKRENYESVCDIISGQFGGMISLKTVDGKTVLIQAGHSKEYYSSYSSASFAEQIAEFMELKLKNDNYHLQFLKDNLGEEWYNYMDELANGRFEIFK